MAGCLNVSSPSPLSFMADPPKFTPDNPIDTFLTAANLGLKASSGMHAKELLANLGKARTTWAYRKAPTQSVELISESQKLETPKQYYVFFKHINSYLGKIGFLFPHAAVIKSFIDTPLTFIDFTLATGNYKKSGRIASKEIKQLESTPLSKLKNKQIAHIVSRLCLTIIATAALLFVGCLLKVITSSLSIATYYCNEHLREEALREKWAERVS